MPRPEGKDREPRSPWWKEGWLLSALSRAAIEVFIRFFWHDGGPC